jgi:hypothetical protein
MRNWHGGFGQLRLVARRTAPYIYATEYGGAAPNPGGAVSLPAPVAGKGVFDSYVSQT